MTSRDVLQKVMGKIVSLPTLPSVLENLNRMMANPRTGTREVATLIGNDPVLVTKILRVANSSFYAFSHKITTVNHAVAVLGFNAIRSIVLSTTIFDNFVKGGANRGEFDRVELWKHSVGVGCAARVLARRLQLVNEEDAFVGGLLHDLGKIILDQYLPDDFAAIAGHVKLHNCLMVQAEQTVLGLTHAEMGAMLLKNWKISPNLVAGVGFHHNVAEAEEEHRQMAAIIHLGDILCRAMQVGSGGDKRIPAIDPAAWQLLKLTESDFDALLDSVHSELAGAMVFFDFMR